MTLIQQFSGAAKAGPSINFQAMLAEQEIQGANHPLYKKQDFLGLLIKFASLQDHQTHLTGLGCNGGAGDSNCKGQILVLRTENTGEISWGCDTCTENGEILNWERSEYDLSHRAPVLKFDHQEEVYRIKLTLDEYQLLINPENLYFDLSTERVLFRAKFNSGEVEMTATETELENMLALLLASLKHETAPQKCSILDRVYRLIQTELDREPAPVALDS